MKKTVTVNISGIIFHIDEDAYEKLLDYIEEIKSYLSATEGIEEIIADVEARIAEMLQQKLMDNKQVINIDDINVIISTMGAPSQFGTDKEPTNNSKKRSIYTAKRFYRDPDNKVIGGVCSGIGHYFNVDPLWIRIVFAVALFVFGSGVLLYLFLWLITPEARTTVERLEMKGEAVNINNIEKSVKEELSQLKRRFRGIKKKDTVGIGDYKRNNSSYNFFERVMQFIFAIIRLFAKFFVVILGAILIFIGIFLLIGFFGMILKGGNVVSVSNIGITGVSYNTLIHLVFSSSAQITLITIGLILLIGIPLIMIIYNGVKMIFGLKTKIRFIGISAFSLWITGLIFCVFVLVKVMNEFSDKAVVPQKYIYSKVMEKPFYIDVNLNDSIENFMEYNNEYFNNDWYIMKPKSQKFAYGIPNITITNSESDSIKLIVYNESRGNCFSNARENAINIKYKFIKTDSSLVLDPVFTIQNFEKWRMQRVRVLLKLPEGEKFIINKRLNYFMFDIDNRFLGKKLIMREGDFVEEQKTITNE